MGQLMTMGVVLEDQEVVARAVGAHHVGKHGRSGAVSEPAYDAVCAELERLGAHVERGVFGADLKVESLNDGPITVILER